MALDRFVYLIKGKPSKELLGKVLKTYVRGLGKVKWKTDRYYVTLPGKPTDPKLVTGLHQSIFNDKDRHSRWIEVYLDKDYVDVITREQDEIINGIAQRFAEMCARIWKTRLE